MTEHALDTNSPATSAEEPEKKETLGSFLWFVAKLVIAVLIFRSFIFSPFTIPSESMLPNLRNGDYLVAAKWPYGFSKLSLPGQPALFEGRIFASLPERGDVVIFKHPVTGADYVKRVIGLPGDTVAMEDGVVVLNGAALAREDAGHADIAMGPNTACRSDGGVVVDGGTVCRYRQFRETLPSGESYLTVDFGAVGARFLTDGDGGLSLDASGAPLRIDPDNIAPVVVPEGKLFVMGDNRDNSLDSRFPAVRDGGVGLVDADLLVGRASRVLWSTDGSAEWLLPWTWFTAARWDRIGSDL
ncbi:signal peptidase I [Qipengyuania flava]|uniref:signal peptidase I n=1 Tax=Qipengyuania flava TaxID=192812 RepID=UPI001C597334|nr:signal peptidase I [Qipengyuania flava]MBW3168840.1 signal peptidase I [Qipengyuania flava]MBY5966078.1 signal peptidase I [Qipengyuania flava]MBY6012402.1 signal peptidase I [Qipengyuania flava]MBY6026844.1 signal peptidase I [Qipengyuania flava]